LQLRHDPPGIWKWNWIVHRLVRHIIRNWRGKPLANRAAIVEFIAASPNA